MRSKIALGGVLAALVSVLAVGVPAASAQTSATNTSTVPIVGTVDGGGTFTGTFDITKFSGKGGQLVATGTLTGTITDALGNVVGTVSRTVTLPVTTGQSSCTILELTLGPLDLDLLGLVVHLDQVYLLITAEPGPGNLLGNLLCEIAGLLDNGASLNAVADKLNQVLRRL